MNYQKQEYLECGVTARWLELEKAKNAYEYALQYSSNQRYGLNEKTVSNITPYAIQNDQAAKIWLKEQFPNSGTVQIVHGREAVCVVDTEQFLDNWNHLFMPGRDDVLILHNTSDVIAFYYHEEILEIGQRLPLR